ncbi:MAG: hypothetical protein ABI633_14220 [Burkholderiales bacterium]
MQAQSLTFALTDSSAGYEATPERVRLEALTAFVSDVSTLLRGANRELDPGELDVAVRAGSLAIVTEPISAAPALFRDLRSLLDTELLDAVDTKRREVIERWQKAARQTRGLAFRISAGFLARPLVVDERTDFRADDADQWVMVERYVRGEIQDLGGAKKANAHVRLPGGTSLLVATERKVLKEDTQNRLYKPAMLRIRARYNVLTRELKDAQLIEFVDYAPRFDEAEMERLTRRGAQAWKDVDDATTWVDELRGGGD